MSHRLCTVMTVEVNKTQTITHHAGVLVCGMIFRGRPRVAPRLHRLSLNNGEESRVFTVLRKVPMLDDIRWEFGSRRYLSLEQFVTEVSRVNKSAWPHDEIVMHNPKVAFEYSAVISSLDELLPCENLAHADAWCYSRTRRPTGSFRWTSGRRSWRRTEHRFRPASSCGSPTASRRISGWGITPGLPGLKSPTNIRGCRR